MAIGRLRRYGLGYRDRCGQPPARGRINGSIWRVAWAGVVGSKWFVCCCRPPRPAPAARRYLFRRVSSPGSTVYLLGSIHFGRPEMYPLSSAIDQAYARADALVVEADVTAIDPEQTAAWMAAKAMYRDGTTLAQHLPPAVWRRLS